MEKILNKYVEVEANRAEAKMTGLNYILQNTDTGGTGTKLIVVNANEKVELEKLGYRAAKMGEFPVYVWGR